MFIKCLHKCGKLKEKETKNVRVFSIPTSHCRVLDRVRGKNY